MFVRHAITLRHMLVIKALKVSSKKQLLTNRRYCSTTWHISHFSPTLYENDTESWIKFLSKRAITIKFSFPFAFITSTWIRPYAFPLLSQAAASLDLLENVLYFVSNGYKNRVYSNFFVNSLKWRREGNNENGIVKIWRFCFRMRGRPLTKWGVGANLFWALECSSKKFVPFYFHHL